MRFLIVDDHAVVRRGTIEIVADISDSIQFDEAGTSEAALKNIEKQEYALILLDISLPDESGLQVLKKIRTKKPALPILVLSMHPEEEYAVRAFKMGADGYLTKNSAPDELIQAIKKVMNGGKYVSASMGDKLISDLRVTQGRKMPQEILSPKEFEVLSLLAQGNKSTAIAKMKGISVKTVSTYKVRGMKKLKLKNNAELVRYALSNGLLNEL